MNAHARRAGFSEAVAGGGVLAGFCITEVLDEKSPQIPAESPAHPEWGCRGADPRALQVWAQSSQGFPPEAIHRLQCCYLHIFISNAQALRGLSFTWPHSFQRPVKPGKGLICAVTSPTWNSPPKCPLIHAMPIWFLKEGFHKGALPQPWPFAGLAGTFPIQSTWNILAWIPVVLLLMSSIFIY